MGCIKSLLIDCDAGFEEAFPGLWNKFITDWWMPRETIFWGDPIMLEPASSMTR
ncbi:MAG TPA: hypothetical protein VKR32_07865 [Puia sp.]|nr:hypothetical protein [Puia sp.]